METFDFTTLPTKRGTGATKWMEMLQSDPTVPLGTVPLTVADMELVYPTQFVQGMQRYFGEATMCYTAATPAYYDAVIRWMQRRHAWQVEPEWIVPFEGVVPALFNVVRTYTQPGESVAMLSPVYHHFYSAVQQCGRKVAPVELLHTAHGYEIDFDALAACLQRPETKLLLFCSPHNPVGRVWRREELCKVAQLCEEHDIIIVSDEIHEDILMPGFTHIPLASLSAQIARRCVTCTSPTKAFNLAGLKVSNIIISDAALRQKFVKCKDDHGGYGASAPGFYACELVYNECEPWLEALLAHLRRNRDTVEHFMAQHLPQIAVQPLEGTYLQWWDCRGLGLSDRALEEFLHRDARLFLSSGYEFGKGGEGFARINLACPTWVVEEALARLEAAATKRALCGG
ncbi:MAG: pyridoxal phosphate-dependent aminotransferase [Gemmiger sp.]|nr:pyridoxal phosphate-dependent aminotransferase [Gemmiger sp.]